MFFPHRSFLSSVTLATAALLSGCAVSYNNKNSTPVFSADIASVLGRQVDSADMPDGNSKVTLRELGNEWSLRFEFSSQVIPLGKNLLQGNIVRVDQVGNNITLLLRVQTARCAEQYRLVSIDSRKHAGWWELPCANGTTPNVIFHNQQQALGFVQGDMLTTYIYHDGKLSRIRPTRISPSTSANRSEPTAPPRAQLPASKPRPKSAPPKQAPATRPDVATKPAPVPANPPVVRSPTPAPIPAPKPLPDLTFSPDENIKPNFEIDMK